MRRLALASALALACNGSILPVPLGDSGTPADAGIDAGTDAGTSDAGADAGPGWDAGWPDAGGCPPRFSGAGETIATGFSYPRHLAVAPDRLFVSEVGVLNKTDGGVDTVYLDGGVEPLLTGRASPDAIVTDGANVYFADQDGLWKIGFDGGTPLLIDGKINGALEGNTALVLTGTQLLYATGTRWLELVKTSGSSARNLFTGDAGTAVTAAAIDGTTAYFLVQGPVPGLYQASLTGSANPQRVLPEPTEGSALWLDATNFYWATGGGGAGKVQLHPRSGGSTSDIASGLNGPGALFHLGSETYFQDSTAGSPATPWFWQVQTTCLSAPIPVGPIGQGVGEVALTADGGSVYFTSNGGNGQGFVGVIR